MDTSEERVFDEEKFSEELDKRLGKLESAIKPRNRAERRAVKKKFGEILNMDGSVKDDIKKAVYVEAIQRLREYEKKKGIKSDESNS